MKNLLYPLLFLLAISSLNGQPSIATQEDNSPAVIAQDFALTYGVRAEAIEAILWIYQAKGYDANRRSRATEEILKNYAQVPEKTQRVDRLSKSTLQQLGITNQPQIADALEWDLFAGRYYLSTTGKNSPAILAKGNVHIWYGIPAKTLRALAKQLEKNHLDRRGFEVKLAAQVEKYEALKEELRHYAEHEEIYERAEVLLAEGKLAEADQLISEDYLVSKKRQAYKGYVYGKTKELSLQYAAASVGYRDAITLDPDNTKYQFYYAYNEATLANYDEAIKYYEMVLDSDTLQHGKRGMTVTIWNNLGLVWSHKGDADLAIFYYEKALKLGEELWGTNDPRLAAEYNNLGNIWDEQGDYDKALAYYKKSLDFDLERYGANHPNTAIDYGHIGSIWEARGAPEKALFYYEQALQILLDNLTENHPSVAIQYSNMGGLWSKKGNHDLALQYYEKALQIDVAIFGMEHLNLAIDYNDLGLIWDNLGNYDQAILYYEKALAILTHHFGDSHLKLLTTYHNLALAWEAKAEYDKTMSYFQKCQAIAAAFLPPDHPDQKRFAEDLAYAANEVGLVFYQQKKYQTARTLAQLALKNARFLNDTLLSVTCWNNLGIAQQQLQAHELALQSYEQSLQLVTAWNQHLEVLRSAADDQQANPQKLAEAYPVNDIRYVQCRKLECLNALQRKDEAENLAKQLWQFALDEKNEKLLAVLAKEGYRFGETKEKSPPSP